MHLYGGGGHLIGPDVSEDICEEGDKTLLSVLLQLYQIYTTFKDINNVTLLLLFCYKKRKWQ